MSVAGDLCDYLQEHRAARFDWRALNCATFAAGWVRRATGVDALAGLAATGDALHCARLARTLGGLRAAVSSRLGLAEKPAAFAAIGDVVLVRESDNGAPATGGALGICCGRTVACLAAGGGLEHVDRSGALCAWALKDIACRP